MIPRMIVTLCLRIILSRAPETLARPGWDKTRWIRDETILPEAKARVIGSTRKGEKMRGPRQVAQTLNGS